MSAAVVGGETLVRVEDLRVHFPITSGVVFQRTPLPPAGPQQ